MNKKTIALISGLVIIIAVAILIIIKITCNDNGKYKYYVYASDNAAPSTTYLLKIDEEGNYTLNTKMVAALSTGPETTENDYEGQIDDSTLRLIKKISDKIDSPKGDYKLYYEQTDNEDKNEMAVALAEAITWYNSEKETTKAVGLCRLNKISEMDLKGFAENVFEYVNMQCRNQD